ncbi:uncharacterized protein LOC113240442 [Hyposmocoma kahamanoa]|uniref:uncharacterized protein LOC113240442 n=1 Tax=Hyposmocoma kahamanoa TaxID=1477025 RepID=UPI000E6D9EA5|nr:uncharacterized protein LOC113240442 [Hyposmocoma kahamanoa]
MAGSMKLKRTSYFLNAVLLFVSMIYGAGGLRTIELRITPRVVQRGKNVTMACMYQLHDYGIYSVKWYKGAQEFYRYSPLESPTTRLLPVTGVKVDRISSNETHVVLVRVGPSLSGNYTCEVIQNAPTYPHFVATSRLDVVGAGGLRAIELRISPPVVQRGSDAILACLYELTDAPLYSVKWYRGRHEFYRYSPTETPATKIFPFAGINVDLARSNQSQVVLTRVSFGLSGNFSCEVTADAPSFATSIVSSVMEVVVLPPSSPSIQTNQLYYRPGDLLQANCTSGPSRPAAELALFINDMPVTPGLYQQHPAPEGLFRSKLYVEVQLWPANYDRGAPILRCEAKIGDLYKDDSTVALYTANSDPKIERVTFPRSAAEYLRTCQILLLLHIIAIWINNT